MLTRSPVSVACENSASTVLSFIASSSCLNCGVPSLRNTKHRGNFSDRQSVSDLPPLGGRTANAAGRRRFKWNRCSRDQVRCAFSGLLGECRELDRDSNPPKLEVHEPELTNTTVALGTDGDAPGQARR
jgi:hypothetical protein